MLWRRQNFSETRCTQRDTMLWRRPKRAPRLVRFWMGRGLAARWEWRWCIGSHCAANGVRDWLRSHRIHGRAPNKSKKDPRQKIASLTRRGSEYSAEVSSSFLYPWDETVCSFWHKNQQRTVAETPSISMHWNARSFNISSRKTREFNVTSRAFFWKKIQMELDRYFWQSCDWQLSFVPGHFEHGFRSVNFRQNCCVSKAHLYDLGSKAKGV